MIKDTRKEQDILNLVARRHYAVAIAFYALLLFSSAPQAWTQDRPMHQDHGGHEGMLMAMDDSAQMDASQQRKLLADKKESEFNHHLAGFFVILAGLLIFAKDTVFPGKSFLRYAWPACFLVAGLCLLAFSDTELWPFGPQSWWYGLTHNPEDLQHKTFALILLALGIIEVQRARGILKSVWATWAFPVLAAFGSVLLLFHEHHTGMHGAGHMNTMAHIQAEHFSFAIAGFGIGAFRGLSEVPTRWQVLFSRLWPLLMIGLGVLLLLYSE